MLSLVNCCVSHPSRSVQKPEQCPISALCSPSGAAGGSGGVSLELGAALRSSQGRTEIPARTCQAPVPPRRPLKSPGYQIRCCPGLAARCFSAVWTGFQLRPNEGLSKSTYEYKHFRGLALSEPLKTSHDPGSDAASSESSRILCVSLAGQAGLPPAPPELPWASPCSERRQSRVVPGI